MDLDYLKLENFLWENKYRLAFYTYVLVLLASMLSVVVPGLYITDESVYLLMVHSMAKDRSLSIWNGMECDSAELDFIASVDSHGNKLYPQYPQLYTIVALPFYVLWGLKGLVLLNVFAFCATVVVLFYTCMLLFSREALSLASVIVYSAFTYSARFAVDVWPHSLTVFLVAASVYLALRWINGGGTFLIFSSGFLSAFAIGVRYQAALYSAVLLLYVFLEARRRLLSVFFVVGMLLPLSALLLFNFLSYGGFFRVGYSDMDDDFGGYLFFQFFALCCVLLVLPYVLPRVGVKSRVWGITLVVFFAMLTGLWMLDPLFIGHITVSMRVLAAEVFDISRFPVSSALVPWIKKSVLQAAPVLALSLPGCVLVWYREKRGISFILTLLAFTEILFFSGRPNQHGGLTHLMRYFLQSLPYLSILVSYALADVYRRVGKRLAYVSVAVFFVFVYMPFLPYDGDILQHNYAYHRILPVVLSALLLALFAGVRSGSMLARHAFTLVLLASVSYSFVVNATEIGVGMNVRKMSSILADELSVVRDNSTVLFYGTANVNHLAQLKAVKTVRLANADVDDASTSVAVIGYYLDRDIPVYLLVQAKENDLVQARGFNDDRWTEHIESDIKPAFYFNAFETKNLKLMQITGRRP